MRIVYKSHGKHCHLRSFQTTCRNCGAEVLYWECIHGSKIFFNYPIYGKLIRHICVVSKSKRSKDKYPVIIKSPEDLFVKESFYCPVCGKFFKKSDDRDSHIRELKKFDVLHKNFYENELIFDVKSHDESFVKTSNKEEYNLPKFGKINIRKRKK